MLESGLQMQPSLGVVTQRTHLAERIERHCFASATLSWKVIDVCEASPKIYKSGSFCASDLEAAVWQTVAKTRYGVFQLFDML